MIGGGYAGMAAAVELAARGVPVTVFESAKQLGGRGRGVLYSPQSPENKAQLDNGQHLLLGCYRETLRLIELVGGDPARDFLRLPLQLELCGHFSLRAPSLPAPLHLLAALLRAEGLSWAQRGQATRLMLALRRLDFRLAADCSVADLLARYGQDADLTLKLWEPLTLAALNTPLQQASAQVLLNVLRDSLHRRRADSDMLLPRLDLTALFPQRAADYVSEQGGAVRLACPVEALRPAAQGFELQTASGSETFAQVICATSPVAAAKLLRPLEALAATLATIDALQYQPIYTVYLRYPAAVSLPQAMIGLYQRHSQWLFDQGKISGQPGLIASVISAAGQHQLLSHAELAQRVAAELGELFAIKPPPLWHKVIAEKRATFACDAGLLRPARQTALSGLWLAGDYTAGDYPATLEGAVRSGICCAKEILNGA